jgi:hypothetical protein
VLRSRLDRLEKVIGSRAASRGPSVVVEIDPADLPALHARVQAGERFAGPPKLYVPRPFGNVEAWAAYAQAQHQGGSEL